MCKDESSRVDFAMAEALAFGTLALRRGVRPAGVTPSDYFSTDPSLGLNRGHYAVRLSGQDSERGTFNQRHAALYDQATGERLLPSCTCMALHPKGTMPCCDTFCLAFCWHVLLASAQSIWERLCGVVDGVRADWKGQLQGCQAMAVLLVRHLQTK